jgi:hypothetical protein
MLSVKWKETDRMDERECTEQHARDRESQQQHSQAGAEVYTRSIQRGIHANDNDAEEVEQKDRGLGQAQGYRESRGFC